VRDFFFGRVDGGGDPAQAGRGGNCRACPLSRPGAKTQSAPSRTASRPSGAQPRQ
jgi:hypothetical protein